MQHDRSLCTEGFTVGKSHFKNKFCAECRKGGVEISAERVRVVPAWSSLVNDNKQGLWNQGPADVGPFRLINQTVDGKVRGNGEREG